MSVQTRVAVLCDRRAPGCNREFVAVDSVRNTRKLARLAGWTRSVTPAVDVCPVCGGTAPTRTAFW